MGASTHPTLADNQGGIIFKPVFSSSNPRDVANAISQANKALKDETFREFLLKHAEAGINMSKQHNDPKILEFKFLKDAIQRLDNAKSNSKKK